MARTLLENPSKATAYAREWRAKNLEKSRVYQRTYKKNLRREVIEHYGGKCACCDESELAFLALDHKNGGGTQHRNELGLRGDAMYGWVKREGFPDMFQVLCHNCNAARGYYGECPHEVV